MASNKHNEFAIRESYRTPESRSHSVDNGYFVICMRKQGISFGIVKNVLLSIDLFDFQSSRSNPSLEMVIRPNSLPYLIYKIGT